MILWLILALSAGVLAFFAYLYFSQSSMMFHPTAEMDMTPSDIGLEFDDVYIDVGNGQRINGWYIPVNSPLIAHKTILFFHGNGGNMSHRLETIDVLHELGIPQLHIDYRGYGKSDGEVGESECYADAVAAADWLEREKGVTPDRLVLFGRSLGGAVAVDLATRRKVGGLIVESSFTSAVDMGKKMFPFLPVKYLVRFKFASDEKIADVSCPVLVTHSPHDDLIPFEMGRKLYELAPDPKRFLPLSGGHNERLYMNAPQYRAALREWTGSGEDGR